MIGVQRKLRAKNGMVVESDSRQCGTHEADNTARTEQHSSVCGGLACRGTDTGTSGWLHLRTVCLLPSHNGRDKVRCKTEDVTEEN